MAKLGQFFVIRGMWEEETTDNKFIGCEAVRVFEHGLHGLHGYYFGRERGLGLYWV